MVRSLPVSHGWLAECCSKKLGSSLLDVEVGRAGSHRLSFRQRGVTSFMSKKKKRKQESTHDKGWLLVGCGGGWVWKGGDVQKKVLMAFDGKWTESPNNAIISPRSHC